MKFLSPLYLKRFVFMLFIPVAFLFSISQKPKNSKDNFSIIIEKFENNFENNHSQ